MSQIPKSNQSNVGLLRQGGICQERRLGLAQLDTTQREHGKMTAWLPEATRAPENTALATATMGNLPSQCKRQPPDTGGGGDVFRGS